jgi:hypothetical protein
MTNAERQAAYRTRRRRAIAALEPIKADLPMSRTQIEGAATFYARALEKGDQALASKWRAALDASWALYDTVVRL